MSSASSMFCQFVLVFSTFNYIFMLSNKSVFHLFFGFVFPVHYVLVSRHAVLCLFPVCVYSYTFKLFLLQSSASFSKTFWLRSKASIANEQDTCHEASHMKIRMKLGKTIIYDNRGKEDVDENEKTYEDNIKQHTITSLG